MFHRRYWQALCLALALFSPSMTRALALSQYINAATCDYNTAPDTVAAVTGTYFAGRNSTAVCAITQPASVLGNPSPVLDQVLYWGQNFFPGSLVTAQLCQFDTTAGALRVECGPETRQESVGWFFGFVQPPSVTGFTPTGTYLYVTFGPTVSFLFQMQAFWSQP
jgi:hypothetical protein